MSSTHVSEHTSTLRENVAVERVLTVFDNATESLIAEHSFVAFDLESFKRRFGVSEDSDPLMFDVYPVRVQDAEFVAKHLDCEIVFDFDRNAYFVECSGVE